MKKAFKIIISILIVFIVFACACGIIDKNRISNNKKPIFCINKSGGSVIFYIGPGYVISGAWDDNPGGLANAKIHSWIWLLFENR